MEYHELREALTPHEGVLTISPDTLTPNVATLFATCYDGNPITVTEVRPGPDDGEEEVVVLMGKASFLRVNDLPVEVRARVEPGGNARLFLKYRLIGAVPDEGGWKFSHSFPDLPPMVDWSRPGTDPRSLPLDALRLSDAYFMVSSECCGHQEPRAVLEPGINFVATLHPAGLVAHMESFFQQSKPIPIQGFVQLPRQVETQPPLEPMEFPWDLEVPPPGITIFATLMSPNLTLGKMTFRKVSFRHYTPPNQQWLDRNPTYQPVLAYKGQLVVPSARMHVDAVALFQVGGNELFLNAKLEGFTLRQLSCLVDIAGIRNLLGRLPPKIQEAGELGKLGKLELTHAALEITYSEELGIDVGMVALTVGMPQLKWQVWEDRFEIDSILCSFTVFNPFPTPKLEVTVQGVMQIEGVPVNISASSRDGFTVYAEMDQAQSIPVKKLLSTYARSVPPPSDLTVDRLRVSVAPFREYSFAVALADQPNPWVVDLEFAQIQVANLELAFTCPKGGELSASFGGDVALFDWGTLTLRYDHPGDLVVRGVIEGLQLSHLIRRLVTEAVTIPAGFDLCFDQSYAMVQKSGPSYVVRMGTALEGIGVFALEVRKTGGTQWGIAAGVSLTTGACSLSPALAPLADFERRFGLRKLLLVISSFADTSFTFPDPAAFEAPSVAGGRLTLPGQGGVIAGFNLFGEWTLDSHDKVQMLLQRFLKIEEPRLGITLQVGLDPAKDARLYARFSTPIKGLQLSGLFGGQISAGCIGLFLEADLSVEIQKQPQLFSVKMDVVENGALFEASPKSQTPVAISYRDVEIFKIGNLALAIGCDWEGVPTVGVTGQIELQGLESALAVFFDSAEPQKSLIAGAVSDLNAKQVVRALAGEVLASPVDELLDQISVTGTRQFTVPVELVRALDNMRIDRIAQAFAQNGVDIPTSLNQLFFARAKAGSSWYLTDQRNMRHYQLRLSPDGKAIAVSLEAQLYCVNVRTEIGTLTPFEPAYYLSGAIDLLGFHAEATIDIEPGLGISLDAQMDKIVVYREGFFSIQAAGEGNGGPVLSVATFTQQSHPDPLLREPHICISGEIHLLGLTRSAYVSLTKSGLEFDLKGQMLPLLYLDGHGRFKGKSDLQFGGAVKVGVEAIDLGPLGKIAIDDGVNGALALSFDGVTAEAKLAGSFLIAGSTFPVHLHLDVATGNLADLARWVRIEVLAQLNALFKDPQPWADAVYGNLIRGVNDVALVLQKEFDRSTDEAERIVARAKKVADQALAMSRAAFHQ